MKKSLLFLILVFSFISQTEAQDLNRMLVDVFQNSVKLDFPFAGGLKSPQFSEVDLNGDGIQDLYIFDKAGNVQLTFINKGTADEVDYRYEPYYAIFFPELVDWVLLRDYNGDGVMDIFAQHINPGLPGVEVYTGRFVNNHLEFDRFNFHQISADAIPIPTGSNQFTQLYVSVEDIPAIDDMNGDGDLDILTFSVGGGSIYLYENQSIEQGYGKDSLIFRRVDDCWGKFYEPSVDNCLLLSDDPDECITGLANDGVHAGSTVLTFDQNNDGDKEALLGDISFNDMVLAINGGDADQAYVTDQDCGFPSYDVPIDVFTFPSAFMLDVDNDGLKDLIATANTENSGVAFKSVWYYKNINSNEMPTFSLQTKNFMIDEMLQFGFGANPTFVDYNVDGLMDLVVGTFRSSINAEPKLYLLENVGTINTPVFQVVDEDWLGFKTLFATSPNFKDFSTAFGDLDGDGDEDLIVGSEVGDLLYAENIAGPGQVMSFGQIQGNYMGIDPGQASIPEIVDIDRDGLLDILIGERTINADPTDTTKIGNINFYKNIGTATQPMFNSDADAPVNNRFLGRVNTLVPGLGGFNKGESAPAVFDTGMDYLLFTGSASGRIMVYNDIVANIDGTFNEVSRDYGSPKIGITSRVDVADINNDGFIDIVVGNKRGGLNLYSTNFRTDGTVSTQEVEAAVSLKLFPNPASSVVYLEWESKTASDEGELLVFDALGQRVAQQRLNNGTNAIDVNNWSPGIYFADLRIGGERVVERFVVSR